MKLYISYFVVFILVIDGIVCSSDVKSSLTMVIDDTGSMTDDIAQVKIGANAIFDTVMNSNVSQIEDFILLTFSDPDVQLRTITTDRVVFKNALNGISVHGGGDCPEMSMGGILLALQKSREGSAIYVFTDAAAKDFGRYDEVKALSIAMACQIVFVLTGTCSNDRHAENYLVYHKIAKATNGRVFHLNRNEIGQILNYVRDSIESRKTVVASKSFPPGYGNTFDVEVDGDMKELYIVVTGTDPSVGVTDSDGTKWPTTDRTRLKEVAIVKVAGVKPGVYKVEVGSKTETEVLVTGSTTVHFQHGFSIITPSSIEDTVKRPVPGEKSHLSIKLATEGGTVELRTVQILDMDDEVILEKPLRLVDKENQFYTTDNVIPPDEMFKIAIKGYDTSSKSYITRISLTPVEPQKIRTDTVRTIAPVVSIVGAPTVNANYNELLQLKCKVSGYPKPSVIWESDDKSSILSHTMSPVELPYDYVSVLNIRSVTKNSTFVCKAVNSAGSGKGNIDVQTKINKFFRPLLLPSDKTIEYQKRAEIPCKVEALPPATVTWYKGGEILKPDKDLVLSADGSVLIVRSMEPEMDDNYICEVRNSAGRRVVPFKLTITGVDRPEINKDASYIRALRGSRTTIQCKVIKGYPKPNMLWMYKGAADYEERNETTDFISFDKVESTDAGSYRCIAENVMGWDLHEVELLVEFEPEISKEFVASRITANQGDDVMIRCLAKGVPTPDITWKFNGAVIRSSKYTFFRDGSIRFSATLSDKGKYECEARNRHGIDSISVDLDITIPVDIESPKQSVIERMVGAEVTLLCRADGSPKPKIEWVFRRSGKFDPRRLLPSDATGVLRLPRVQLTQNGTYTCVATNSINSKNITYLVSVLAPPYITYKTKQFQAVVDDMHLRIPCKATGNPEPDITWTRDGYNIASGSDWYDIADDGSLIIKNIKKYSEGYYTCTASNLYGNKQEMFQVIVDPFPHPGSLSHTVMIEKDSSATIPCRVPHMKTDRLSWYKDGRLVSSSELLLRNVTQSNAGTYTCRVSFVDKPAQSGTTEVEVGFKPRFTYPDDEKNLTFEKDNLAVMDCTATAVPEPQVKWFHDGKEIRITEFKYDLEMMKYNDSGTYTCEVTNRFGTARQEFVISSSECLLDIKDDFNENEPLMMTSYDEVINFDSSDGYLHIPKEEKIKLICPSGFNSIPASEITVTCDSEQQFIHHPLGSRYSYSDLKCRDKLKPVVRRTGNRCTNGDSEMLNIGFEIGSRFNEIYQVCLDRYSKNPIYTKLNMQSSLANVDTGDKEWFNYDAPTDMDSIYECNYQNSEISAILDKEFHRDDRCCFARRMLVNPKDVAPGLPQAATYTRLNVAPHWSSCNSENWEDVEQRVRHLTLSTKRPLHVWTGVAEELRLQDAHYREQDIVLNSRGKEFQVPKFLWKVVQDPDARASVAIIQVNVPDLNSREAVRYQLCTDICDKVEWMKSTRWRAVERGYTYCCNLADFESAFRFYGVFPSYDNLLSDAYLSESHFIHA